MRGQLRGADRGLHGQRHRAVHRMDEDERDAAPERMRRYFARSWDRVSF